MVQLYGLCTCGSNAASVPLEGVHVEAKVVDMIAQVSIVQYYVNNTNSPIECRYVFPLDSFSAVCGFEAEIDGKIIVGQVKEKQEARREYDNAIARGDGAYLLEESKADIFEVLVGNVPPQTRVNIWITYITELKIEADESTRFLLPTAVAPRYTPPSSISWNTPWYEVFTRRFCLPFRHRRRWEEIPRFIQATPHSFSVMIEIESPSNSILLETVSPSHCIQVDKTSDTTAFVSFLHSDEALGKDFILDYKISEPHKPRAIIESDDSNPDHLAAMVTLVPDFSLDDVRSELIFVVDRSGSMSGKFIQQAKEGLQLFLRGLPMDCYFNIIGFGSNFTKLYDQSKKYSQSTLAEATAHINSISANLGGTELMKPLQFIFGTNLIPGYTRNIFVLTDGQVSNTEQVCQLIRSHNQKARVFALGVGNQVSHDLVEGMARAGKGNARFIVDGQRMDSTIMRQLKDSLQPALTDISIDWGYTLEEVVVKEPEQPKRPVISGSLIGHRSKNSTPVPTPRKVPACYCQTPFELPPVFSGTRFMAYAFLKRTPGEPAPHHIIITAQSPDGPLNIELEVEEHAGNLVQKLTARSLIRDLEEGHSWFHGKLSDRNQRSNLDKQEIIRLGTTYNLVSKYTSFIAVEPRDHFYPMPKPVVLPSPKLYQSIPNRSRGSAPVYASPAPPPAPSPSYSPAPPPSAPPSGGGYVVPMSMGGRGGSPRTSSVSSSSDNYFKLSLKKSSSAKKKKLSAPLEKASRRCEEEKSDRRMKESAVLYADFDDDCALEEEESNAMSCKAESLSLNSNNNNNIARPSQSAVIQNNDALLQSIVLLQQFDGSFTLSQNLAKSLRLAESEIISSIPNSISSLANKNDIWVTVLTAQFFALVLADLQVSWELIVDKSKSWLRSALKSSGVDLNSLLADAKSFLQLSGVC